MHSFTVENKGIFYFEPLSGGEVGLAYTLCNECVGENLYSEEEIAAAIGSSNKFFYLLKNERGETVGYIYYYLTNKENIVQYAKIDVKLLDTIYFNPKKKVGKIQSIGLKEEYRGIGLASEMIRFMLCELKEKNIDITFIVCWKPGGILPLGKVLSECNFNYLTEAKKVWYDDTELICPYCKGRCMCDAEVYYKLICEEKENET